MGQNIENVKVNNRASTLRLLLKNGPVSRIEIAASLRLTPATVTTISNEFLNKGLIIQKDELDTPGKVGRKKCPVELNYEYKYVIAIHIHTRFTNITVCNLAANPVASVVLPTERQVPPEEFLGNVAACCTKLLWDTKLAKNMILGVGVSIIGPVNQREGISINAFSIWDQPVEIRSILEDELNLPVCVESNVCASMAAILLYDDLKDKNILGVNWGPGVGSASVINGEVFKGRGFQSAEVGHNFVDKDGPECQCGRKGCLETQISMDAIIEKLQKIAAGPQGAVVKAIIAEKGDPTRDNLHEFLDIEDSVFAEFLNEISYKLAVVVNNAIQILAPDRIVLFGALFTNVRLLNLFKRHVFSINDTLDGSMFIRNRYDEQRNYIGGTAIVVDRLLIAKGGME